MASMLPGTARTCLGCLRRSATLPSVSLPTAALQTRGKKNYRPKGSMRDGFIVRLTSNIKGYGPKGTLMRIARGRYRNIWFPQKMATRITDKEFARLGLRPEDIQPRDPKYGTDVKVQKINLQMRLYELEKQAASARNLRTVLNADGEEVEVPEEDEASAAQPNPFGPKITPGGKKRMRKLIRKRKLSSAERHAIIKEAKRVALRRAERAERTRQKKLYEGIAAIEKIRGYKNKQSMFDKLNETHRAISQELSSHTGVMIQSWDPGAREYRWLEPPEVLKLLADAIPEICPVQLPNMAHGRKRDPHDKTEIRPQQPTDKLYANATIQDVIDGVHAVLATSKVPGASDIRLLPTDLTLVRARPARSEKRSTRFGARFAVNIRIAGDPATVDKVFSLYGQEIRGPNSRNGKRAAAAAAAKATGREASEMQGLDEKERVPA